MEPITLFDQNGVTVLLRDLRFDKEIDGVRASIEAQNQKDIGVEFFIVDLWDGERFYEDYYSHLCTVPPKTTEQGRRF